MAPGQFNAVTHVVGYRARLGDRSKTMVVVAVARRKAGSYAAGDSAGVCLRPGWVHGATEELPEYPRIPWQFGRGIDDRK